VTAPNHTSRDAALAEIHLGTAAATGREFFDRLVKHLARALGVRCAWVTEYLEAPRRLRAISFWAHDRYVEDYEYAIRGTPCEEVIDGCGLVLVPDRVVQLFPDDPDLPPLGAVSYMGAPLLDSDGRILGHLAILDDRPMRADPATEAVFSIFGARAAGELGRDRRDRELRERETRLARLVGSAMDAIVEMDDRLRVTRLNPAARHTFGIDRGSAEELADEGLQGEGPQGGGLQSGGLQGEGLSGGGLSGKDLSIERLLGRSSHGRLALIARELERRPEGTQSVWIPEGLEGRTLQGTPFPAEGSLSRYELDGRSCYTLILRNIDDRLEAERRVRELTEETAYLRSEVERLAGFDEILGESPAIRAMLADIQRVAPTDASVLITGETGTGKELIARAIHRRSARKGRPLIRVNCAAIPENLQESEFFGHERGAFTGATQRRDGRFRLADGGTIFLDEIGEMPMDLQAKLLRVLQEGEFERVGGTQVQKVDVRVVAATNRDLARQVREGRFREDLLYRLDVFPIHAPPLREREEDVILLAEAFLDRLARTRGLVAARLDPAMKVRLRRYDWPGNVRELQNVMERALITSTDGRTPNLDRALPERGAPYGSDPAPAWAQVRPGGPEAGLGGAAGRRRVGSRVPNRDPPSVPLRPSPAVCSRPLNSPSSNVPTSCGRSRRAGGRSPAPEAPRSAWDFTPTPSPPG